MVIFNVHRDNMSALNEFLRDKAVPKDLSDHVQNCYRNFYTQGSFGQELGAVVEENDTSILSIQSRARQPSGVRHTVPTSGSVAVLREHLGAPFKPECYWFEPVDLLRKLALTGVLQFFSRGSQFQVFLGCCVAVGSLVMQLHFRPYAHGSINHLKMLVDLQIFLTFLISLVLRTSDPGADAADTDGYAWALLASIVAVACVGVAMLVRQTVEIIGIVRPARANMRVPMRETLQEAERLPAAVAGLQTSPTWPPLGNQEPASEERRSSTS